MKNITLCFLIIFVPCLSQAQFEQKVSINLAAGIFKTFGKKLGEYDPMQMSNYKVGFSLNGGLQFKLTERFSLVTDFGIMMSNNWSYSEGDNNDYLYWYIPLNDTSEVIVEEGYNYLDIRNYSIGIKPKYYLLPGKKLNPYLFAGINVNWTSAWFENNYWAALNEHNMLPADDTGPYNDNLEHNFGIGFNPGLGVEYSPTDKISFCLSGGYYFITLNKENFKNPYREENYNAFILQAGLRYSFIKSKDL